MGIYKTIRLQTKRLMPTFYSYLKKQKMKRFYAQFLNKGDLCFDLGANMGNRTEIYLDLGCTVISVEPQKKCIDYLEKQYGENKRVTIVSSAVGEKLGNTEMFISEFDQISTLSKEFVDRFGEGNELSWDGKQQTDVTTLDHLIDQFGIPDFTKIDVEGFEVEVLRGLSIPIPALSFEFTSPLKYKVNECVNLLMTVGDYRFKSSSYESMKFNSEEWLTAEQTILHIQSIPKQIVHGDIYAILQAE